MFLFQCQLMSKIDYGFSEIFPCSPDRVVSFLPDWTTLEQLTTLNQRSPRPFPAPSLDRARDLFFFPRSGFPQGRMRYLHQRSFSHASRRLRYHVYLRCFLLKGFFFLAPFCHFSFHQEFHHHVVFAFCYFQLRLHCCCCSD